MPKLGNQKRFFYEGKRLEKKISMKAHTYPRLTCMYALGII
jgi:hypothetical protein